MRSNITDVIAGLVRQTAQDLDTRLEYQAEALRETKCTDFSIGKMIDVNHVEYLLSALAMCESDFAETFPATTRITWQDRREVATAIEEHLQHCRRCSLKHGYELELDRRIELTCRQHRDFLLQLLDDEEATSLEGKSGNRTARTRCA